MLIDLNNIDDNTTKPNACPKVISIRLNISGISQFHNHIVSKAKSNPTITIVKITTEIASIIFSIVLNFLIN